MHFVRFRAADGSIRVGAMRDGAVSRLPVDSMHDLLARPLAEVRAWADDAALPVEGGDVDLLAPIDGHTEVWASGVTYLRSMDARVEESAHHHDVYERAYHARRPELFYKAAAWRVMTDGEPVGIREDSSSNVPEGELALMINSAGELVGYLVCNDVSSRSIEGENPIYLPQAKMYAGSCSLSTGVRPAWEIADASDLAISVEVRRDAAIVFAGATTTGAMKRTFSEIIAHLLFAEYFPHGVVISTGTGIVPDLDFTLLPGDTVAIHVREVGTLTNTIARGKVAFGPRSIDA